MTDTELASYDTSKLNTNSKYIHGIMFFLSCMKKKGACLIIILTFTLKELKHKLCNIFKNTNSFPCLKLSS